jgi:CheY-like chemotaxis protein
MTKPPRILIVDDEPMIRDLLSQALEIMGHSVETCSSGRKAVESVEAGNFDLVMMDVGLPDITGFEAMASIKAKSPQTPVILISGNSADQSKAEALAKGASAYVVKPIRLEDLAGTIQGTLDSSRA